MKMKLTLTHKKILAGIGLGACVALGVGGLVIIFHDIDAPDILSRLCPFMVSFGLFWAWSCGKYLYKAIFRADEFRKEELEKNDERNQLIRGKAAYITYIVSLVIIALLSIGIYVSTDNETIESFVPFVILVPLFVYASAKWDIEKKM